MGYYQTTSEAEATHPEVVRLKPHIQEPFSDVLL